MSLDDIVPRPSLLAERDALAADLALTREALDWALRAGAGPYNDELWGWAEDSVVTPPPHLAAILDASRKRVCGHE